MRLFIMRHAESYSNTQGRLMSTTDLPLTAKGEKQALAAKNYLDGIISPKRYGRVFSSPLLRAAQTAEIVAGGSAAVTVTPLLREMELGELEGLTWEERNSLFPDIDLNRALSDATFPKGESYHDVAERCSDFISGFLNPAVTSSDTLVVCHGITARVLINILLNKKPGSVNYLNWLDNASFTELYFNSNNNSWEITLLNERKHLEEAGLETPGYETWGIFSDINYLNC